MNFYKKLVFIYLEVIISEKTNFFYEAVFILTARNFLLNKENKLTKNI